MNNIKIIYDTMNDLPDGIKEKYDIEMLPATIIFEDKEYKAGIDINNEEFYKILRNNKDIPKTSQVSYMTFKETFEKYLNEGKKVKINFDYSASGKSAAAAAKSSSTGMPIIAVSHRRFPTAVYTKENRIDTCNPETATT